MGGKYREMLKPFFDNKFYIVFDKRGIGGFKSLVSTYLKLPAQDLLQVIQKFQHIECSEYLWIIWDFDITQKYSDPNRPHCCFYCCFQKDDKCKFSKKNQKQKY